MNRSLMLTAMLLALAVLALVVSNLARAGDARCDAPPYGAAPVEYSSALRNTNTMFAARLGIAAPSADVTIYIAQTSKTLVDGAYRSACLTKLDGVDVDKWGGRDVRLLSIAQLAALVILGGQ